MAQERKNLVYLKVESEEGCPLYSAGSMLCFRGMEVSGEAGAPICFSAVNNLFKKAQKVAKGTEPGRYKESYCGGCEEGRAWFSFSVIEDADAHTARFDRVLLQMQSLPIFSDANSESLNKVQKKTRLYCGLCDLHYNVAGHQPTKMYRCPRCDAPLAEPGANSGLGAAETIHPE